MLLPPPPSLPSSNNPPPTSDCPAHLDGLQHRLMVLRQKLADPALFFYDNIDAMMISCQDCRLDAFLFAWTLYARIPTSHHHSAPIFPAIDVVFYMVLVSGRIPASSLSKMHPHSSSALPYVAAAPPCLSLLSVTVRSTRGHRPRRRQLVLGTSDTRQEDDHRECMDAERHDTDTRPCISA